MPWYVVHTKSRHEYKVHTALIQKGVRTFLPELETWSKRKDRKKKIKIPLFAGYLFAESILTHERKLDILKTPGVVRILGKKENAEPVPVSDDTILAIKRFIQAKTEIFSLQYPQEGERAKIISGPFAGIEGIVVKRDCDKDMFVISIDIMHRAVAVRLEGFQIAKL